MRMSQCPLQQNKDFNALDTEGFAVTLVAMPPPTEQGFQQVDQAGPLPAKCRNALSNRTRISTRLPGRPRLSTPRRNAPSNRTRISTRRSGNPDSPYWVAMPPPTEQGFQRHPDGVLLSQQVAMPPPTEQGFQRPPRGRARGPTPVAMPPPTEQGFQRLCDRSRQGKCRRNALSNRTRISTGQPRSAAEHGPVAMPPPIEQGFQPLLRWPVPPVRPVAMPPPTEQGFQQARYPEDLRVVGSQCLLQQNKDFNGTGCAAWQPMV